MATVARCVGTLALVLGCCAATGASEALDGQCVGSACQAEAEKANSLLQRASMLSASAGLAEEDALTEEEVAAEAGTRDAAFAYPSGWNFLPHCLEPDAPGGFLDNSLPECKPGAKPDFAMDARIAVVGAGPGGVSISKLLYDRGFRHIKLIELSDRVGGKSKRYSLNGQAHELGTSYTSGKYECIEAWARAMNMTQVRVDKPRIVSSPGLGAAAPHFADAGEWVVMDAHKNFNIRPAEFAVRFKTEVDSYARQWAMAMNTHRHMFPASAAANRKALSQSFKDWLVERKLTALISPMALSMAAQGYGSPEQVTAYQGLTWMHPNLLLAGSRKWGVLQEGFQALWERLIDSTGVVQALSTEVESIERPKDGKVHIKYKGGGSEVFDWLIMAAPMPRSLELLEDVSATERKLFGQYVHRQLVGTILETDGTGSLPDDFQVFSWPDRVHGQSYYRTAFQGRHQPAVQEPLNVDGDERPLAIRFTSNVRGHSHRGIGVLQIASPNTTDEKLTDLIRKETARYNMFPKVLARERWDYGATFTKEDIEEGRPWKIWDVQGQRNTWWVGSYVSFESVADIVDYNFQLINARLCGGH